MIYQQWIIDKNDAVIKMWKSKLEFKIINDKRTELLKMNEGLRRLYITSNIKKQMS